jgi:hypothetical protein
VTSVRRCAPQGTRTRPFGPNCRAQGGSISGITGEGRLVCKAHGMPLLFDTCDRPRRVGKNGQPLRPGQTANEGAFRIRVKCTHTTHGQPPCGRPGLQMKNDWSALTRYPHYPQGDPRDHAMREALLARLNQIESLFNRLGPPRHEGRCAHARARQGDRGGAHLAAAPLLHRADPRRPAHREGRRAVASERPPRSGTRTGPGVPASGYAGHWSGHRARRPAGRTHPRSAPARPAAGTGRAGKRSLRV